MINIAKKKLPSAVLGIFVYLSYCAMNMFAMRGNLAYYGEYYGFPSWFTNDIWAFFVGGLWPFVIFELFVYLGFRTLKLRTGGDVKSIKYGLCLTVIAANLVLALFKFVYLAIPLYASIINILVDPIITIAFVALYMLYAFKQEYVDKSRFKVVLSQVMSVFLTVYLVLAVLNLIVAIA